MMTIPERIIHKLEWSKGDDLYRAKAAFKNRTPAQMQEQYGYSGETCQQIIDGYQRRVDEIDELIAWVKAKAREA